MLCLLIFILCLLLIIYNCFDIQTKQKVNLWIYWQGSMPEYIKLCIDIIKIKSQKYYMLHILDDISVTKYLPHLDDLKILNKLLVAQKADYIRINLLYLYGGLWMDADTIMYNTMKQVYDKQHYDFIGFGCTGDVCHNGYKIPSNGVMYAKKSSILMKRCLDNLNKKLINATSKDDYFMYGKYIIWEELKILLNEGYANNYYHFDSSVDGTRDVNGKWVAPDLILKEHIDMDKSKLMFVMLANSIYCGGDTKYNWFCGLSRNEILGKKLFISELFNDALH